MGWDFFQNNGGRRAGGSAFPIPPLLEGENSEEEADEDTDLQYETEAREMAWGPINTRPGAESRSWSYRPLRFVDGKDAGQTVAWLRSPEGYPIPVRLGQIGAIVMRNVGGRLVREWSVAERVVAIHIQPFGWEEIEGLAYAMQQEGFRLLDAPPPYHEGKPSPHIRVRTLAEIYTEQNALGNDAPGTAGDCRQSVVANPGRWALVTKKKQL